VRLNHYDTLGGNQAERKQSHRCALPVLVVLTERGEHRAAEETYSSADKHQQVKIVREYENAAITGTTDACPVSQLIAVGGRENPASCTHYSGDRQSRP